MSDLIIRPPEPPPKVPPGIEILGSSHVATVVALESPSVYNVAIIPSGGVPSSQSVHDDAERLRVMLETLLPSPTYAALGKLISQQVSKRIWKAANPDLELED